MARGEQQRSTRAWRPRLAVGAIAVAAAVAWAGSALAAAPMQPTAGRTRVGDPPPLAYVARTIGAVPASTAIHLTVVLKPRHALALARYARGVSTPGSRVYRAFLTPAQFAARYGASTAEVRSVQGSMRARGLLVGPPTANRLAIPVRGSAAQIERAFAISFRRVLMRGGERAVVANAAPALDRGIAGDVQAVIGLTSVSAPKPLVDRATATSRSSRPIGPGGTGVRAAGDAPQACPAASAAAQSDGAYTADQIASTYGFSGLYVSGAEGQGETVAVYELESYNPSDVAQYQSCYGTSASIGNVMVDGGPGGPPAGSGEAALDIEQLIGLAPKAGILVYEGPNSTNDAPGSGPYDTLSRMITDDRARVVSISWGECEQAHGLGATNFLNSEDTLFQEAATQGQSVVSATGDQGSEDCPDSSTLAVDDPGSQPFVTGVGGTTLEAVGPPPTEAVWNRGGPSSGSFGAEGGAGGGGVSSAWQMPGYQRNAPNALHVLGRYSSGSDCGNSGGYCREVPDVAADADPYSGYVFYWSGNAPGQGVAGWQAVGGTSAAAPVWAALLADANSSSACRATAIGFANPDLYQLAATNYGEYFNDITSGNNDFTGTGNGLYPAGPEYDMASGVGSPNAATLGPALCRGALHVENPGSQISTVGQHVSLKTATSALPGTDLHFYATDLPPGLSISGTTGRITGRPKRIGTWRSGVAALGRDLSLRGAFFDWHVGGSPRLTHTSVSGVAAGHARLSFTITAGRSAAWLMKISVRLRSGLAFSHISRRVSITIAGAKRGAFTVRLVGGRLQITVAKPVWRIRVTVRSGAIRTSRSLAAAARGRRAPVIAVDVMTTDSAGHGVAVHAHIRPHG